MFNSQGTLLIMSSSLPRPTHSHLLGWLWEVNLFLRAWHGLASPVESRAVSRLLSLLSSVSPCRLRGSIPMVPQSALGGWDDTCYQQLGKNYLLWRLMPCSWQEAAAFNVTGKHWTDGVGWELETEGNMGHQKENVPGKAHKPLDLSWSTHKVRTRISSLGNYFYMERQWLSLSAKGLTPPGYLSCGFFLILTFLRSSSPEFWLPSQVR
jgi:hypothetical protein